jgi:hypothetical protein
MVTMDDTIAELRDRRNWDDVHRCTECGNPMSDEERGDVPDEELVCDTCAGIEPDNTPDGWDSIEGDDDDPPPGVGVPVGGCCQGGWVRTKDGYGQVVTFEDDGGTAVVDLVEGGTGRFPVENVTQVAPSTVCDVHGHVVVDRSEAGPDSGNMDWECSRCGVSKHVPLY